MARKYMHSGMGGAPQWAANATVGRLGSILSTVLVHGFNTQAAVSATAADGVLTLNYASAPGYEALSWLDISGASVPAAVGQFRVQSVSGNQVLVAVPGIPDGPVGGTITTKVAPLGWLEPFAADGAVSVFQQAVSPGRYVRVFHAANSYPFLRGYRDMTDLSTGTEPFPTVGQVSGNGMSGNGYTPTSTSQWWIWGDEKFFVFHSNAGSGISEMVFMFGEPDGVPIGPAMDFSTVLLFPSGSIWAGYALRIYTAAVEAKQVNVFAPSAVAGLYPSPETSILAVSGAPIFDNNPYRWRGFIPGHVMLSCRVSRSSWLINDVPGVNGRLLIPGFGGNAFGGDLGGFLIDDEVTW